MFFFLTKLVCKCVSLKNGYHIKFHNLCNYYNIHFFQKDFNRLHKISKLFSTNHKKVVKIIPKKNTISLKKYDVLKYKTQQITNIFLFNKRTYWNYIIKNFYQLSFQVRFWPLIKKKKFVSDRFSFNISLLINVFDITKSFYNHRMLSIYSN